MPRPLAIRFFTIGQKFYKVTPRPLDVRFLFRIKQKFYKVTPRPSDVAFCS